MSEFDENATSEERIEYLRARGIQIEIPGERQPAESSSKPTREVTVVKVPCDEGEDLHEVTVDVEEVRHGIEEIVPA